MTSQMLWQNLQNIYEGISEPPLYYEEGQSILWLRTTGQKRKGKIKIKMTRTL